MVAINYFTAFVASLAVIGAVIAAPTKPMEFPPKEDRPPGMTREIWNHNMKAEAERINFVKGVNKVLAEDWCAHDDLEYLQKEFEARPLGQQNKIIKCALEAQPEDELPCAVIM
jgi:hypothetical protein